MSDSLNPPDSHIFVLTDNGVFPNNERLPLVIYRRVFPAGESDASRFEELFLENGWSGCWRDGIHAYHHYHSTAHEALGVAAGSGIIQFGGEQGIALEMKSGDALVIPAGVAHKSLNASEDFLVVGAYPKGQQFDMCTGKPVERPQADENIARAPLPKTDPFYGTTGPLMEHWKPY